MKSPLVGKEVTLILKDNKGFLVEDRPLSLEQLSLPILYRAKSEQRLPPVYLKLFVTKHYSLERKLVAFISEYGIGETDFTVLSQFPMDGLRSVQKVIINDINTLKINRLIQAGKIPLRRSEDDVITTPDNGGSVPDGEKQEIKDTLTEKGTVPVKNLTFGNGIVSFKFKMKEYPYLLTFTIENENLKEEYDAIKNYFGNVWKAKNIDMEVTVRFDEEGYMLGKSATSLQIQSINSSVIDNLKMEVVGGLLKRRSAAFDKDVIRLEEAFELLTDGKVKANLFYKEDNQLFNDLLTISNTKHYRHLRYLSAKHLHHILKLRFILKPFGFLFLVEGATCYYLVWETLDTKEATYMWPVEKSRDVVRKKLPEWEVMIKHIKVIGRQAYIETTKDEYKRTIHDYEDTDKGFLKWKEDFERKLLENDTK